MRYEIINPSDKCFLDADELDVAAIACVMIGQGAYALEDEKGETAVPIMFTNEAVDRFCHEAFQIDGVELAKRVFTDKKPAIAAALRSVRLADGATRTSMNDIVRCALQFANKIDPEHATPAEATP